MSHADSGTVRAVEFTKILEHPFGIARITTTTERSVLVEIDGGWGEAAPSRIFGETFAGTLEILRQALADLPPATEDPGPHIDSLAAGPLGKHRSALAAIDMALHDRWGRAVGEPVWRLLGADPAKLPISSFTIGIDETEEMLRKVATVGARSPILKIKLGRHADRDVDIVRRIREAVPDKTLRVDANQGWSLEQARPIVAELAKLDGIDLIEQPLSRRNPEGIREISQLSPIPVYVDENCHTAADIPALARICKGVNVKLMKSGGLREALRIVKTAREHGLGLMLGCMVETSVGISAAAQIAPLFDHIDLDGHVLITNDPFEGCGWDNGRLTLSDAPGLGLRMRPGATL
jgi:L-alanine-DL-glutamate epimerase-like enolase superfamily enzyme